MPQGDKSKYTDKQDRKVDHIAKGLRKPWRPPHGSRAAAPGDGQQGRWRRQEKRLLTRQIHRPPHTPPGAPSRTRTGTPKGRGILSAVRLPIPPRRLSGGREVISRWTLCRNETHWFPQPGAAGAMGLAFGEVRSAGALNLPAISS